MNDAIRTLVEMSLRVRSVSDTAALFKNISEPLSFNEISNIRLGMIRRGEIEPPRASRVTMADLEPIASDENAVRANQRFACDELLRRHLMTGKHWITDPVRFAQACESVGLAA